MRSSDVCIHVAGEIEDGGRLVGSSSVNEGEENFLDRPFLIFKGERDGKIVHNGGNFY